MRSNKTTIVCCLGLAFTLSNAFVPVLPSGSPLSRLVHRSSNLQQEEQKKITLAAASGGGGGGPTELPDSLADAAVRAAEATRQFYEQVGVGTRCRVDFDTTIGDETYTILKSSTEFMQKYVSAMCNAMIPGVQEERQREIMAVASAKAELRAIEGAEVKDERKEDELIEIINSNGRKSTLLKSLPWQGPVARIYFPDEGSAALARRDWLPDKVPACCSFSSCGGVQMQDISNDTLIFFFCPKASEADFVEDILARYDNAAAISNSGNDEVVRRIAFVNPRLVDMGVTGFGMAGRLLRERLIDTLVTTYYLRTLQWGALTRKWPDAFSVYQEDESVEGGYRLIKVMDRLPSNPEVEDIYDIENGLQNEKQSGGILDQIGDFVNGMMRL